MKKARTHKNVKWILFLLVVILTASCMAACSSESEPGKMLTDSTFRSDSEAVESGGQEGKAEKTDDINPPTLPEYTPVDPASVPDSPEGDFIIETAGGCAYISGYQGSGGRVKIPKSLGGEDNIVIHDDAFKKNESITWIYLPETVTYIPKKAFLNCKALEEAIICGTDVSEAAFKGCEALRRVELGEGCTVIGGGMDSGAFQSCTNLTEIAFPSTLTSINTSAFMDCMYLETVDLSGTQMRKIGQQAFTGCTSLKNLSLPASLSAGEHEGISSNAFLRCPSINNVQISEDNSYLRLDNGVLYCDASLILKFQGYDNPEVSIAEGTTSISANAFEYDERLKSVKIPDSVETIGRLAFSGCSNLEEVVFGTGLAVIEQEGFSGCVSLKKVNLPDNEIELGSGAFYGCKSLEKVLLPEKVNFYGNNTLEDEFSQCENTVFTYKGKEYTYDMAAELDAAISGN